MPYKHWVGGSNPSATTRYSTGHGFSVARFFFRQRISRLDGSSGLPVFRRRRARFLPGFCKVFSISRLVPAEKWRVFRDLLPGFCALFRKS